jgi:predicted porin
MTSRTILAAAAAALGLGGIGAANAQSAVTLYGIVDAGITYIHNSGGENTQIAMTSGRLNATRWGLKGSEDLGGGMKAIFTVESGFSIASGGADIPGTLFSRQAFMGLADDRWGTLTLGRQYDPMTDLVAPNQADAYFGGLFTTPGDIDNADSNARLNNSVKWLSNDWHGFRAGASYAFGGVAGSVASGQAFGGALSWNAGPFAIGAGGLHIDNGNPSVSARQTKAAESMFFTSINSSYASAAAINIGRVAGSYTTNGFTFGGYYSYAEYVPDGYSQFTRTERFHIGNAYVHWQVGPSVETQLAYTYMHSSGDSSAVYQTVTLGALYDLSKRTALYIEGGYGHASGNNGSGAAQAVIGAAMVDAGKPSQVLVTAGIRQLF